MSKEESEEREERELIPFISNYVFAAVMQRKDLTRRILQVLVPYVDFSTMSDPVCQHFIRHGPGKKAVALDCFVKGVDYVVDVEMQPCLEKHLGNRMRIYEGSIDQSLDLEGVPYKSIPHAYITFLCSAFPFSSDKPFHVFDYRGNALNYLLKDRFYGLVYNDKNWERVMDNPELRELLHYCASHIPTDDSTRDIHRVVEELNENREIRKVHSSTKDHGEVIRELSREEVREEVRKEVVAPYIGILQSA